MKKRRVIIILGGILVVLLGIGGIAFYQFAQSGFTSEQIWEYDALIENKEFVAAISRQMNKPGFFQHSRNEQNRWSQPSN